MTGTESSSTAAPKSPWLSIELEVYEQDMVHAEVGQLAALHHIMTEQITEHPARRIGILGVAGGNGLDLIDPASVDAVYGYDLNPDYLAACAARHRPQLGDRLQLIETAIDRDTGIEPVDLLIANLIIEYLGIAAFAAFLAANTNRVRVLSCMTEHDLHARFVSSSPLASAFGSLTAVSVSVDAAELATAVQSIGLRPTHTREYALPNGKSLIRQDFSR